jgi:hypothetical protein
MLRAVNTTVASEPFISIAKAEPMAEPTSTLPNVVWKYGLRTEVSGISGAPGKFGDGEYSFGSFSTDF